MTLDFAQLGPQVERMGLEFNNRQRTLAERLEDARRLLFEWSNRQPEVWKRVELAKDRGAKFRGASPIGDPLDFDAPEPVQGAVEPMAAVYPLPECPESATLIAVDGSQIYPDPQATALYYLINIGVIVFHHGTAAAPTFSLHPQLFYDDEHLYINGYRASNTVVNAQRTIAEREHLAAVAKKYAGDARPLLAVSDGPLLFWGGADVPGPDEDTGSDIVNRYIDVLGDIYENSRATLTGYVDRPASTYVIRLLHLLSLDEKDVDQRTLATSGELEGLDDRMLFKSLLTEPGARSALFIQRSPTNKRYAQRNLNLEIAFFYMNTAMEGEKPYLARVEVPMWVARHRDEVGAIQALLYHQCQLVGRYPYMLTRADELAVVQGFEKRQLDNLIEIELRKRGFSPEVPAKPYTKTLARN